MRAGRKGEAHRRPAGREVEPHYAARHGPGLSDGGGAGAEAGRGRRPRGFSVGPERATSEPEAGVAARLMRRDGRSSSAVISRKSELGTYLSRSTK